MEIRFRLTCRELGNSGLNTLNTGLTVALLPWEYGIRNLLRRPLRSGLTLLGLTTVILLVLVVVGFV